MIRLIRSVVRPYRKTLAVVLAAMLLETVMSLAAPWPLKIVLDNVVGGRTLPQWLHGLLRFVWGSGGMGQIALFAGIAMIATAAIDAMASYIESYSSESVSQARGTRLAYANLSSPATTLARLL